MQMRCIGQKILEDPNQPQQFKKEIESKLGKLAESWAELRRLAEARSAKLEENLEYQQFLATVEEEESWVMEKQHLLTSKDFGETLAAVQGLQKKHEALETDCGVHQERANEICKAGDELIARNNYNHEQIAQRCEGLSEKFSVLKRHLEFRKQALADNSAFLQFLWKTDVVENWIVDREMQVRSDEYGRDLSSVQTLLTKQETFDAGLVAFEKEGIASIKQLKDKLIEAKHVQSAAIDKRFNDVMNRWNALKRASETRRKRLLDLQKQYKDLEELYLLFAKKASAFNSWFENAEEDLTDPVRCNSVEEIKVCHNIYINFLCKLFLNIIGLVTSESVVIVHRHFAKLTSSSNSR